MGHHPQSCGPAAGPPRSTNRRVLHPTQTTTPPAQAKNTPNNPTHPQPSRVDRHRCSKPPTLPIRDTTGPYHPGKPTTNQTPPPPNHPQQKNRTMVSTAHPRTKHRHHHHRPNPRMLTTRRHHSTPHRSHHQPPQTLKDRTQPSQMLNRPEFPGDAQVCPQFGGVGLFELVV